jgi:hypothetical protein
MPISHEDSYDRQIAQRWLQLKPCIMLEAFFTWAGCRLCMNSYYKTLPAQILELMPNKALHSIAWPCFFAALNSKNSQPFTENRCDYALWQFDATVQRAVGMGLRFMAECFILLITAGIFEFKNIARQIMDGGLRFH